MLDGYHEFNLPAKYPDDLHVKLCVGYEVSFAFYQGDWTGVKAVPTTVGIKVGNSEFEAQPFNHMSLDVREFIINYSQTMGLQELGISDEDAKEVLKDIDAQEETENSLRGPI